MSDQETPEPKKIPKSNLDKPLIGYQSIGPIDAEKKDTAPGKPKEEPYLERLIRTGMLDAILPENAIGGINHKAFQMPPKVPEEISKDPMVQRAVIATAAELIKRDALRRGLGRIYQNAPEINPEAIDKENPLAPRLRVEGRLFHITDGDAKIVYKAEADLLAAAGKAYKTVAAVARVHGINDEAKTDRFADELVQIAKKDMEAQKSKPVSGPQRSTGGRE